MLVVDEIGYLPVSRDGAVLFLQLINARHERASTVLTSNKGFEEWSGVLGDEVMAAAPIDRLLHHCHIVNIRGNSYRMRDHQDPMPWRCGRRAVVKLTARRLAQARPRLRAEIRHDVGPFRDHRYRGVPGSCDAVENGIFHGLDQFDAR